MRLPSLFRNRSIRFKLSLIVGLNGSLALVLVAVFLFVYDKAEMHRAAERQLSTQAGIMADANLAALSFADRGAATDTLTALRNDPTLVEAAIHDAKDRLFAAYERLPPSGVCVAPPANPRPAGVFLEKGSLIVSQPILLQGQRIGTVFLRKSMAELDNRQRRYIAVVCLVLFGALGLAQMLSTRMHRALTAPLAELSNLARFVSVKKDYSVRAERHSSDEVGVLVDSFNEMLAQIEIREESLRESEERFALAAKGANDGLWDWKRSTGLMYMSPRGNQMFGFPEVEKYWTVKEWSANIHRSDRYRVAEEWMESVRGGQEDFVSEYRMRHQNGTSIWVLSRGRSVRDGDGHVVRVAGSLTDITTGKIADALTGLHSRFYFIDRLESALETASHASLSFAVLFLDLDRFKLVNDSLGHGAGDEFLVEIASRLRIAVHEAAGTTEQGVAARLGGDEFAVLLHGVGQADAIGIAQKILHQLSAPFHLGGRQMFPGASIGIALSGTGATPEDLLRNADTAMYQAKQAGRGRIEVFNEEMRDRAMARMEIEADLREAIERKELVLHYQPLVGVTGGRLTGFEALVRWQHPKRGLIQPAEFIPIAEETGLIIPLGRWVLAEACRQMAIWQARFRPEPPPTISVNVSYRQLKDAGFVDDVIRILAETGLPPESLRLELTESTVMADTEGTVNTLRRLKALNIGLEIDDFGTGYSSLSALKRLPFDTVKIDRSFVRELGGNTDASEIVRAILDLAGSMTLAVVAEGVETKDQLEELSSLGCSYAQGYLFSKPVAAADAAAMVQDEAFRRGFRRIEAGMPDAERQERPALVPAAADLEAVEK